MQVFQNKDIEEVYETMGYSRTHVATVHDVKSIITLSVWLFIEAKFKET